MLLNCVHAEKTGQDFLRDRTKARAHTQIEAESLIRRGILTQASLVKMKPSSACSAVHGANLHIIFNSSPSFFFMPAYLLQLLLYLFYCFGL